MLPGDAGGEPVGKRASVFREILRPGVVMFVVCGGVAGGSGVVVVVGGMYNIE